MPLTVLSTVDGFQTPVIPFGDVNGNTGAVLPLQNGDTIAKSGTVLGMSVTPNVCVKAH